jgi:ribosome-associated protein
LATTTAPKRKKASPASRSKAGSKPAPARTKRPLNAAKIKAPAAPKQKKLPLEKSRALARDIAQLALTKKAFDVVIMDVREVSSVTDFFVIASGATDIQVRAIGRAIDDGMRARKVKPIHSEGEGACTWLLLDYFDVVVHVMQPRVRDYYNLEGLWADAPREEITD